MVRIPIVSVIRSQRPPQRASKQGDEPDMSKDEQSRQGWCVYTQAEHKTGKVKTCRQGTTRKCGWHRKRASNSCIRGLRTAYSPRRHGCSSERHPEFNYKKTKPTTNNAASYDGHIQTINAFASHCRVGGWSIDRKNKNTIIDNLNC